MTMLGVVPGKECLAVSSGILNATETIREVRKIIKRLEVRFREGVVIGNIRPTMSLDDFQIDQQGSDSLRAHAGAAIGVQCEATRFDVLSGDGIGNQHFGQLSSLPGSDHPAHYVAAEDIEDHVQMEVRPLAWAA